MEPSKSNSLLVVISAPSGAGKTTVCQKLLEASPNMTRAITCTTRTPREGEVEGVDYYFLNEESFLDKVKAGEFLEHATVYDCLYGTLWPEVHAKLVSGKDVLLNIDVQGAATIRKKAEEIPELKRSLVSVFLTTSSLAELEARLRKRGTDEEPVIKKRLAVAVHEIEQWSEFDYLLTSQSMEEDQRRMRSIVTAEKLRRERSAPPAL